MAHDELSLRKTVTACVILLTLSQQTIPSPSAAPPLPQGPVPAPQKFVTKEKYKRMSQEEMLGLRSEIVDLTLVHV